MNDEDRLALQITAEENYAHAREHEHLLAQVTSILVAASFVLIGFAIDRSPSETRIFAAVFCILISCLNIRIINIHANRFDRHVDIARKAKKHLGDISKYDTKSEITKLSSLRFWWKIVASLPMVAGIVLIAWHIATCGR